MESLGAWGALLLILSLPGLFAPRQVWSLFAGLNYRTPERVVPSERRFRVARMGSATLALCGAVVVIGAVWPGDFRAKALVVFWSAIIGIVLFITVVIVSVVRRKRLAAHEDELPPDEPSEVSYGLDYVSIVVYLVLLLAAAVSILSLSQQPTTQERLEEQQNEPYAPDDQRAVNEALKNFSTVHLTRYPVYTELPEGATLALPRHWVPIEAGEREPRQLWDQSAESGSGMGIGDADLALRMSAFTCAVTGLVVQETETTVAIAFVVTNPPVEGTNVANCLGVVMHTDYYLVDLASPLGDRELVQYGGDKTLTQR